MKHKLFLTFLAFSLGALIITGVFTSKVTSLLQNNSEKPLSREALVNINDIIKNSQEFLKDNDAFKLSNNINKIGYKLTLYDINGKLIYNNEDKRMIDNNEDLNRILTSANFNKQIFSVVYLDKHIKKSATAIIDTLYRKPKLSSISENVSMLVWGLCICFILFLSFIYIFLYYYILQPFKKLESFAGEVAKGNLDISLKHSRHNIFGAFTWAFDMLRSELKSSKEQASEAEKTKKELVAVLSHDIRTPIASIRAYAECLKGLPNKNSDRSERYLDVIIDKTDELTKLSQDMFLHAISDLEKLDISPSKCKSRESLISIIEPLMLHYENRIVITNNFPDVDIFADKSRLTQVFENIITNTAKYAPQSNIEISSFINEDILKICFKDHGNGVSPEDLNFIFDKFYRGKNAKDSGLSGSGLGLYISKYIMEKMEGSIRAYNYNYDDQNGFVVEVWLKTIS